MKEKLGAALQRSITNKDDLLPKIVGTTAGLVYIGSLLFLANAPIFHCDEKPTKVDATELTFIFTAEKGVDEYSRLTDTRITIAGGIIATGLFLGVTAYDMARDLSKKKKDTKNNI